MKYFLIYFLLFNLSVNAQFMNWKWLTDLGLDEIESSTNGKIYAASTYYDKLYTSNDNGNNWVQIAAGTDWRGLKTKGDTIAVGSSDGRFFISTNGGNNFNVLKTFPSALVCSEIALIDSVTYLIVGTASTGVFISSDMGATWLQKNFDGNLIRTIRVIGTTVFVGSTGGLYRSTDFGITWEHRIISAASESVLSIEKGEAEGVVYASIGYVYRSTDYGDSWFLVNNKSAFCIKYSDKEKQIFADEYMSADSGTTWQHVFFKDAQWITIKDSLTYIIDFDGDLYREELNPYTGKNYFPLSVGNAWQYLTYYYSTGGTSGSQSYELSYAAVSYDTVIDNKTYYRINGGGFNNFFRYGGDNILYRYNSSGDDIYMDFNLISGQTFNFLGMTASISEGYEFIFGVNRYKKMATYHGNTHSTTTREYADSLGRINYDYYTWGPMGSYSHSQSWLIQAKIKNGDSIFLYRDNYPPPSINIDAAFLQFDSIFTLGATVSYVIDETGSTPEGSLFFCDSLSIEYYFSNGTDSTTFNKNYMQHMTNSNFFTTNIIFPDSFYYLGYAINYRFFTKDRGIIPAYSVYPTNGFLVYHINPVDVKNNDQLNPSFQLNQNYPNPFNPTTTIQYSVGSTQRVQLKIYDVLGNEVALLVDEEKSPGNYNVKFDASKFSSGVYIYRLIAGSNIISHKMVVLK